jgi:hypothetical protein
MLLTNSSNGPTSACTIRKGNTKTIPGKQNGNIVNILSTFDGDDHSDECEEHHDQNNGEVSFTKPRRQRATILNPHEGLLHINPDDHDHDHDHVEQFKSSSSNSCICDIGIGIGIDIGVDISPSLTPITPLRCFEQEQEHSTPSMPQSQSDSDSSDLTDLIPEEQEDDIKSLPRSPTASLAQSKAITPGATGTAASLASCLKKSSGHTGRDNNLGVGAPSKSTSFSPLSSSSHRQRPSTGRRVRGLWSDIDNNNKSHFDSLRNETLHHILEYLNLADLCRAGMVGLRWKSLVHTSESLWKHVDATEFVEQAHQTFSQTATISKDKCQQQTGQALEHVLEPHKPKALVIRNVQDRLSADYYLPSISSLQELTLTHFWNLTDTHVHVMLLMTLQQKKQQQQQKNNPLRSLLLEDCPRLSNSAIRSIGVQCTNLELLSLKGNIQIMQDLTPLANLLVTQTKPMAAHPSLLSMFQAPPPPQVVAPPPSSPTRSHSSPPAATSLQSLFAPPGMSPPRTTTARALKKVTAPGMPPRIPTLGYLKRLDLRATNVSASAVCQLFSTPTNCLVTLDSLKLNGDSWKNVHLSKLADLISLNKLQQLDLSCTTSTNKSSQINDKGLRSLAMAATPRFSKLESLRLVGHANISGAGVASLVSNAPRLQELILQDCPSLASKPKGLQTLLNALTKKTKCQRLTLRGCLTTNTINNTTGQEETWQMIQRALVSSTIEHLDIRDCSCPTPPPLVVELLKSAVSTVLL